jgi:large subunit ribosomal protein L29
LNPGDVREKTPAELTKLTAALEEELFRLRFRKGAGQLKQTANIRKTRRDLARVKTALRAHSLKENKREAR